MEKIHAHYLKHLVPEGKESRTCSKQEEVQVTRNSINSVRIQHLIQNVLHIYRKSCCVLVFTAFNLSKKHGPYRNLNGVLVHMQLSVQYTGTYRYSSTLQQCRGLRIKSRTVIPFPTGEGPQNKKNGKCHQAVHKSTPWLQHTILHADWSNMTPIAFRGWTEAVHQVAAVQVGRHRFVVCPYHFPAWQKASKSTSFLGSFARQDCFRIHRP